MMTNNIPDLNHLADAADAVDLDWTILPESLQGLKAIVGPGAALALCAAFGGRNLYVPKTVDADHPLAVILGEEAAGRLCREFAGDRLAVPKADSVERQLRAGELVKRRRNGESVASLAESYRLTPRRVQQILLEESKRSKRRHKRAAHDLAA